MATNKPNKYIAFQKRHPFLNTVLTSLVSIFIGYAGTYILDINPSKKRIETSNSTILSKQDSVFKIIEVFA